MRAEIISIGTELLLGQITDTNASYLASRLPALGIRLYHISQVGDNQERLVDALRQAWSRADLIVLTGGLGPTQDDLTREAICALLGEEMVVQPELERDLRAFFANRGVTMPASNLKQATLIPSARVLPNPVGTAPGWWVENEGHIIVAMPGVPAEMYRMWTEEVVPRLRERTRGEVILTRTLKVLGLGESTVEERLLELIPLTNPTVATYAKADGIHVRLTALGDNEAAAAGLLAPVEERARGLLAGYIYGTDDETLASHVAVLLAARGLSLASAETTSRGALAAALVTAATDPGYLASLRGSLVFGTGRSAARSPEGQAAELAGTARRVLGSDIGMGLAGEVDAGGIVRRAHVALTGPTGDRASAAIMRVAEREAGPRLVQAAFAALREYLVEE
ncbi:MAG: CinA family nicotinamide mononucleotide deamidase-related protein [Chloroflexota bacterium]